MDPVAPQMQNLNSVVTAGTCECADEQRRIPASRQVQQSLCTPACTQNQTPAKYSKAQATAEHQIKSYAATTHRPRNNRYDKNGRFYIKRFKRKPMILHKINLKKSESEKSCKSKTNTMKTYFGTIGEAIRQRSRQVKDGTHEIGNIVIIITSSAHQFLAPSVQQIPISASSELCDLTSSAVLLHSHD